jgi:putative ABC transport system permease protein
VLATLGSTLGLLLATWAIGALPSWLAADYLARDTAIGIDGRVLLFVLAVTFVITISFGLAPVFFYFRTLGIRLLGGRDFDDHDRTGADRVAIVNRNLASRLFPDGPPVGRTIEMLPGASDAWIPAGPVTIVGVASNAKDVGFNEVDFGDIYLPLAQYPKAGVELVVSTSLPLASVGAELRREAQAIEPDLPVYAVRAMDDLVQEALRLDRFHLLLSSVFAALATVMAAIGIYGAMSYAIEQRTQEFGVRLALGARRRIVLDLALTQATRLGIGGTLLGLTAALLAGRLLGTALYLVPRVHNGLLYGVSVADPLTLGCACLALLAVATLAALVPALRATRVDPIVTLRCE